MRCKHQELSSAMEHFPACTGSWVRSSAEKQTQKAAVDLVKDQSLQTHRASTDTQSFYSR